jgi:hypothetical protein
MKTSLLSFKKILQFILLFSLLGCTSSNSWISSFVKYEGEFYIVTEEKVNSVGGKLGEVRYYLDLEEDAENYSSNFFPVGTEIYTIKGTKVKEAIAIKNDENEYIKLVADTSN